MTPVPGGGCRRRGQRAEWDRVRSLLLLLRPDDRELLMLVGWDGLTPAEADPTATGHVPAVPFEHVIVASR